MNKYKKRYFRGADCSLLPNEERVQGDLAYTPSRMMELAKEGVPISTQNANMSGMFDEGTRTLDWEPALENMRHADFADLWEKAHDARRRISGNVKKAQDAQKGVVDGN